MQELDRIIEWLRQFDWSDAQKEQAEEDLKEIQRKTKTLISKTKNTAQSLRLLADKLDRVWKDFKTAHAYGTGAGIVGGLLTFGGGVATFMTAGLATPLLVGGMAVGGAGAVTNLAASHMEASINSKELEKAQKDFNETIEYVNIVNDTIKKWQDGKDYGRLLCIFCLAFHTLGKADPVRKILQKAISHTLKFAPDFLKNLKVVGTAGTKLAGQAAAGAADDVASAALKTGGQAADDVVGAGAKAGANASKVAGGVIMGVSVVFLIWDAIDLNFTIRELIEERGSEAAKDLREKARQLDKVCSFD